MKAFMKRHRKRPIKVFKEKKGKNSKIDSRKNLKCVAFYRDLKISDKDPRNIFDLE